MKNQIINVSRTITVSVILSIALSITMLLNAQTPPPSCYGQQEPSMPPDCGSPPVCTLGGPWFIIGVGTRYGYCCYEPSPTKCLQIQGLYVCPVGGGGWTPFCWQDEEEQTANCDYTDKKCFG